MSNEALIDPKTLDLLHALQADHPGLMSELVRLFVADAPGQMQHIITGYNEHDSDKVRQSAHFLRSGAMALGLLRLAETSLTVERLDLAQYGLETAEQAVAELRLELGKVLSALLNHVKEISIGKARATS